MLKSLMVSLLLTLFASSSISQSRTSEKAASIEMLQRFYASYMKLVASDALAYKECEQLKKEYCTPEFLKRLDSSMMKYEIDWDPLIKAQDSRIDCVKNLSFKKSNRGAKVFTVSYFYIDDFTRKKETTIIDVVVKKQRNGKYKISSVYLDTPGMPNLI